MPPFRYGSSHSVPFRSVVQLQPARGASGVGFGFGKAGDGHYTAGLFLNTEGLAPGSLRGPAPAFLPAVSGGILGKLEGARRPRRIARRGRSGWCTSGWARPWGADGRMTHGPGSRRAGAAGPERGGGGGGGGGGGAGTMREGCGARF